MKQDESSLKFFRHSFENFALLRNRISYNYSHTNYLYILLKDTDKRLLKFFCFTDKREVSRFYSLAKSGGVLVEC